MYFYVKFMTISPTYYVITRDARTRPQGRRTRVRRGGTRGRGRDAADHTFVPRRTASCHVEVPNRADAAEVDADSAEIGTDAAKIGPT